jgi:hypothetical protein
MENCLSEMRGASERAAFREKGCKRHGFFKGALWAHKGDVALEIQGIIKCFSNCE